MTAATPEPSSEIVPVCIGCGKHPEDLIEYSRVFTGEDIDPDEYVRCYERTYNSCNGHFTCTDCYLAAGQPSSPVGWVAP